ncbi:lysozyme [Halomonas cupida]|uniref:lysozyme n=1 Tax=Halomonas cupida TaxID=44933 RepID=UPI0039B42405
MDDDGKLDAREFHFLNEVATGPRPLAHRLSASGRKWLKAIEGLRLMPYDDGTGQPVEEWRRGATIGYGHLILPAEWERFRNGIDQQWAESLLRFDLRDVEHSVVQRFRDCPCLQGCSERGLQQHEFDALVILAFNIGAGALNLSSVAAMICEAPDVRIPYTELESAWMAWRWSDGEELEGLIRRRAGEWRIFCSADYALPLPQVLSTSSRLAE